MKNRVEVEIAGDLYNLRTDSSPFYVSKLAQYLSEKINDVSGLTPVISTTDRTILAALNITDELFKLRENVDSKYRKLYEQTNTLVEHIEKHLE